MTINFTSTPAFQLSRQPSGRLLYISAQGERHEGAVPVRAFPLAVLDECISLVGTDGHELVWIDSLAQLPVDVQALLIEELALRDFIPEIRQLTAVSSFGTPSVWSVRTDRGDTSFVLKGEDDIRRLRSGALLIADSEGVHYSIADMMALDKPSRRLLERFL